MLQSVVALLFIVQIACKYAVHAREHQRKVGMQIADMLPDCGCPGGVVAAGLFWARPGDAVEVGAWRGGGVCALCASEIGSERRSVRGRICMLLLRSCEELMLAPSDPYLL